MSGFSDFIINQDEAKKKQKLVINTILDAVKKNLVDKKETEDATIINFEIPGRKRPIKIQVIVTLDYMKKVYRGNYQVIYITIIRETLSSRESDSIMIDTSRVSDAQMTETLAGLKEYFSKLINPVLPEKK